MRKSSAWNPRLDTRPSRAAGRRAALASISMVVLIALALAACASSGGTKPGAKKSDLPLAVDNFRIGWFDTITNLQGPAKIAAGGFDFSMPYAGEGDQAAIETYLDEAAEAGISVYLDIPRPLVETPDGRLDKYISTFKDRPQLLGWYLYDEPEWKPAVRPAALRRSYDRVKELAPWLSIALAFGFLNFVKSYRDAMDMFWFDFYPITKGQKEFGAFRGGRYARTVESAASAAAALNKPLTLIIQGYGEDSSGKAQFNRRLPTKAEARYQFYTSLLGRPASIVYWTLYRSDPSWIAATLSPIIREFRSRFPQGLTYEAASGFSLSGGSCDALVLGDGAGRRWLLLISHKEREQSFEIIAPATCPFASGDPHRAEIDLPAFGVAFLGLT